MSNSNNPIEFNASTGANDEINVGDFLKEDNNGMMDEKEEKKVLNTKWSKVIPQELKRKSKEEIKKQQELLIHISRYMNSPRFGSYLDKLGLNIKPTQLQKYTYEELEELLEKVRTAINSKSGSNIITEGYFMACGIGETMTKNPKIKEKIDLTGLSQSLRQDEELQDVLEAISLEYGSVAMLSPEKRLAYLTATHILRVSASNKMLDKLKQLEQQRANPDFSPVKQDEKKEEPINLIPERPKEPEVVIDFGGDKTDEEGEKENNTLTNIGELVNFSTTAMKESKDSKEKKKTGRPRKQKEKKESDVIDL
jgi:hypothetical protein